MGRAFLISAIGAAIAAAVLAWVVFGTDLLEFGPREAPTGQGGLSPAERKAAILAGVETIGYGETQAGVTVERTEAGAAFVGADGRRVEVAPPEGWRLTGEFVILNEIVGGFFLAEAEAPAETGLYITYIDARQPLEPRTSQAAIARYEEAATRIRGEGRLPFGGGSAEVLSVTPVQDAVFYCLRTEAGRVFQGATRFVGPLSVTAMRAGDCPEDREAITGQIDLAEAALAVNR